MFYENRFLRRPGLHHRNPTVHSQPTIQYGHGPPKVVVMGSQNAQDAMRILKDVGIKNCARRGGIVPPVERLVGSVWEHGPEAVGIAKVPIYVFPSGVEDPSVRQEGRVIVEKIVFADLMDVTAVRTHAEQVRSVISAALVVLGFTR